MPPDEYHFPVKNSVYTNVIAQLSLLAPNIADTMLKQEHFDIDHITNDILIPFDKKLSYHPEYEGYSIGKFYKFLL